MIYISFSLKSESIAFENSENLEKLYNSVYKPLIKILNQNPEFKFSISLNGSLISFLKRKRKEYITVLRQLVDSKQVEIIGGTYFDAILPLLLTVDRNGQIDKLTSEIRQTIGVRPRGINLFSDCWDSSMVNTLQVCGIEYALLNENIIPIEKRQFLPIIMTNLGKSIEIFPTYSNFIPISQTEPEKFVNNILKNERSLNKKSYYLHYEPNRIINIEFKPENLIDLLESHWFEKLIAYLKENPSIEIETTTTQNYRKNNNAKIPAHISCGMNNSSIHFSYNRNTSIYDYLDYYPLAKNLYNRLSYMEMLINQYKGDKMRKITAREKLWAAQNGHALVFSNNGNYISTAYRQKAYQDLIEADKIIREEGNFKEYLSRFDYNSDGLEEYVCQMKNYFSYISPVGGAIQELDILKSSGNYADNLFRQGEFDGVTDNYERGIFIDHLFNEEQLKSYIEGNPVEEGIFSRIIYKEVKFVASHREIQMEAHAYLPKSKQNIKLRKKYIINSDGMMIQYIIKNESNSPLISNFAVESNIASTNFDENNISYYKQEVLSDQNLLELDSSLKTSSQKRLSKNLEKTCLVRLTDLDHGISLSFEPNEDCSYSYYPLIFKRPDSNDDLHPVHLTFVSTLYWKLKLDPGCETEKTINFSITSVKKQRK
ncbi:MAG: DUF1926 domain-containing protein [Treponema sp.]|nr:DUF1926 domain-containing protein [Treponema sp.]